VAEEKKKVSRKPTEIAVPEAARLTGGLRGAQTPSNHIVPMYVSTMGDDAVQFLKLCGIHLDEWQELVLRESLNIDHRGKWAATEGCLLVSRQQGKTVVAEARELVGLFMLGEKLIIHQAQMFATAKESFLRQCARVKSCPDLAAMVSKFRSGNDNVGIELTSGGRLLYQARGPDSLRGFSIDVLVLDEAYALTPEVMAAALHATSAMVNPFILYCSSTGREDSQVLLDLRDRALRRDPRVALWEWKADDGCDPKDPAQWALANPALGIRLSQDFIETEGNQGQWGKEFKRERLGLWADPSVADVIPLDAWKDCKDEDSLVTGDDLIAAVDVAPYRDSATVAMCGIASDGRRQVEAVHTGHGTDWVVDFVKKLLMSSQPPVKVAIQGGGAPGALIAPLLQAGADLIVLGSADIGRATGEFSEAVTHKTLVHLNDPLLEKALGNATRYNIGSKEGASESPAWGFARKDMSGADITPIVACCYAYYGMSKFYADEAQIPVPHHVGAPIGGRIW
jgi:phage terminase large subunit-like protein